MPLFTALLPELLSKVGGEKAAVPLKVLYRNNLVATMAGMIGCVEVRFLVESKLGRKWSMALTAMLAGIGTFMFTLAKTSNHQLIASCSIVFSIHATWAVLYMYTSESFPTRCRATGFGIAAALSRIGGIIAPLLAVNAGQGQAKILVCTSGGLLLVNGLAMTALRIDSKGKAES